MCCDLIGKGPGTPQCDGNGFCVTGSLPLPLATQSTSFQAAASGVVTFGYDDVNTGATPLNPDGTYNLPGAGFGGPANPNQVELKLGGAAVALGWTRRGRGSGRREPDANDQPVVVFHPSPVGGGAGACGAPLAARQRQPGCREQH